MSRCKTVGCEKEAAEGSEYCPACQCARNKTGKNIFKAVLGFIAVVAVGWWGYEKSKKG